MRFSLFVLFLVACRTHAPVPPPTPDASDASLPPVDAAAVSGPVVDDASRACDNLAFLQCEEGCDGGVCVAKGNTCAVILRHVESSGLTSLNLPCVAGATSKETIRSCSSAWRTACGAK